MQAVKDSPIQGKKVNIKRGEINELLWFLNGIKMAHQTLVPTASKFIAKNREKMECSQELSELGLKAILEKYADHDSEGRIVYWDNKIFSKKLDENEVELPEEQQPHGIRAYLNEKKNIFIDSDTGQPVKPIQQQQADGGVKWVPQPLYPKFKDTETEFDYVQAKNDYNNEEIPLHVIQISDTFMTENRVQIPQRINMGEQGFKPLNDVAFFKYLVIDGDLDESFGETE